MKTSQFEWGHQIPYLEFKTINNFKKLWIIRLCFIKHHEWTKIGQIYTTYTKSNSQKKKKLKPLTQKSLRTNLETLMTLIICDRKRDVQLIQIHFLDLIPLLELFYFIFKKHIFCHGGLYINKHASNNLLFTLILYT